MQENYFATSVLDKEGQKLYNGDGSGLRVMIYSHDTLGLGHLQRSLKVTRAIRSRFPEIDILIVSGSPILEKLTKNMGISTVKLPPVRKVGDDQYESSVADITFEKLCKIREQKLLNLVKDYKPSVLLVDHAPIGMKGELLPVLEWLQKTKASTAKIIGLRDIIDDPEKIVRQWRESGMYEVFDRYYDYMFVYGAPEIFNTLDMYGINGSLKSKALYTGYIAHNGIASAAEDARPVETKSRSVMITIGGGEWMGNTIIANYLAALPKFLYGVVDASLVITGPFIPDDRWRRLKAMATRLNIKMVDYVPNVHSYMNRHNLVIATAGYNTMVDLVAYARKALIIPRVKFRKEQLIRAKRFREMGIIDYLNPADVNPSSLAEKITELLKRDDEPLTENRKSGQIKLDGAANIEKAFAGILARANH